MWRVVMSARAIVLMGVWSLFMVLLGTLTVGIGLMFYLFMLLLFAAITGVLVLVARHHSGPGPGRP
jgi:hypothetical protein